MQEQPQNSINSFESHEHGVNNIAQIPLLSKQYKLVMGLDGFNGMAINRTKTDKGITFGFLLPDEQATFRLANLTNLLSKYNRSRWIDVNVTQKGEFMDERNNYVSMKVQEVTIPEEKEQALLKDIQKYIYSQAQGNEKLQAELKKTTQNSYSL